MNFNIIFYFLINITLYVNSYRKGLLTRKLKKTILENFNVKKFKILTKTGKVKKGTKITESEKRNISLEEKSFDKLIHDRDFLIDNNNHSIDPKDELIDILMEELKRIARLLSLLLLLL